MPASVQACSHEVMVGVATQWTLGTWDFLQGVESKLFSYTGYKLQFVKSAGMTRRWSDERHNMQLSPRPRAFSQRTRLTAYDATRQEWHLFSTASPSPSSCDLIHVTMQNQYWVHVLTNLQTATSSAVAQKPNKRYSNVFQTQTRNIC